VLRELSTRLLDIACAAQRFLLDVLPLSDGTSPRVAADFCATLQRHRHRLGRVATEGVIVDVIRKLEDAVGVSEQMLLAQYFALEPSTPDQCERFSICVERLIRARATAHPGVAAALRMIDEYYQDHRFRLDVVARRLRVSPSYLSHLISFHTGQRFRSHVRAVRMRAAASRFADGGATIQEVAVAVGYAHLADFDHHFKVHFGLTPTAYRAQLAMSGAPGSPSLPPRPRPDAPPPCPATGSATRQGRLAIDASGKAEVLIVENDRETRDGFSRVLTHAGYDVVAAADTATGRRLFRQHSPVVTLAGSAVMPARMMAFVAGLRSVCSQRQSLALVTTDAVLTHDQESTLAELRVAVLFKPVPPREIVELVGRLVTTAR
jgi:AraC-like DNA-binding protein/CheY-like chemotaxis protein